MIKHISLPRCSSARRCSRVRRRPAADPSRDRSIDDVVEEVRALRAEMKQMGGIEPARATAGGAAAGGGTADRGLAQVSCRKPSSRYERSRARGTQCSSR